MECERKDSSLSPQCDVMGFGGASWVMCTSTTIDRWRVRDGWMTVENLEVGESSSSDFPWVRSRLRSSRDNSKLPYSEVLKIFLLLLFCCFHSLKKKTRKQEKGWKSSLKNEEEEKNYLSKIWGEEINRMPTIGERFWTEYIISLAGKRTAESKERNQLASQCKKIALLLRGREKFHFSRPILFDPDKKHERTATLHNKMLPTRVFPIN